MTAAAAGFYHPYWGMSDEAPSSTENVRMSKPDGVGLSSVVRAVKDQVSTRLGTEVVLLSLKDSTYYGLDEVGASIWNLLAEPISVSAIRDTVIREYDVTAEIAEKDLLALLKTLFDHGLIEIVHEDPSS